MLNLGPPPGMGPSPGQQAPTYGSKPRPEPSFSIRTDLFKPWCRLECSCSGTDAYEVPFAPIFRGWSIHRELHLMNVAVMDPIEVLKSATSAPHKVLRTVRQRFRGGEFLRLV